MKNTIIKGSAKLNQLYFELNNTDFFLDEGINLGQLFPKHHFIVEDEAPAGAVEIACQMVSISNKENKPIYAIESSDYEFEYIIADLKDIENVLRELLLKAKLFEEEQVASRAEYELQRAIDELKNNKAKIIELERRLTELKRIKKAKSK